MNEMVPFQPGSTIIQDSKMASGLSVGPRSTKWQPKRKQVNLYRKTREFRELLPEDLSFLFGYHFIDTVLTQKRLAI